MKSPRTFARAASRPLLALLSLLLTCSVPILSPRAAAAGDDDWRPVDPAHIALKAPVVEPDADAEAIFWDVRVDDASETELALTHYVRVKVFTERGRESQSKIDIPFAGRVRVQNVAARTIKPDGSIVELKKEDVFERTVVKVSGLKVKAKSFALPGIEPGSIVEYRWREVRSNGSANYTRLQFQRDIPAHNVTYHIKPFAYTTYGMRVQFFHMRPVPIQKEKNGFYALTMTNVPALREEPHMPPDDQVRAWALAYYSLDRKLEPAKFWKEFGKTAHEIFKSRMRTGDEVKRAAVEAVGDAQAPDDKLSRIYEYVRAKVKNSTDDASGLSAAEREKLKDNKSPADTLKRGVGDGGDIDLLFAAMATAAGFDARVALTAPRDDIFFDPNFADPYFLRPASVAVRVGDAWRFYNPGLNHLPAGMLRWQEEGTPTLVADPKEPAFVSAPMSAPERSLTKRVAKLRLSEDGTLEGEVRIEYTGHAAVNMREAYDDDSPAEREEAVKGSVTSRLSTAEVSAIRLENLADSSKPLVQAYRVRVPGYAQRTGKRLFFQPAFFQRNVGPVFRTAERRNEVYFRHAWAEEDYVNITLPEGFATDNAERPTPLGAGDISRCDIMLGLTQDGRTLVFQRKFFFGGAPQQGVFDMNRMRFPATSYTPLKSYFDALHKLDAHAIALKQGAANAAAAPSIGN